MKSIDISAIHGRLNRTKDGKKQIEIRVYFPDTRQRVYKATGIWVKHFSEGKVVSREKNSTALNRQLTSQITEIRELYDDYILKKKPFTANDLRSYYNGENVRGNFNEFFKKEIERQDVRYSTYLNKKHSLAILNAFNDNILWSDLDYEFVVAFNEYLKKCDFKQTTIFKVTSHVKSIINLAINMDMLIKSPYRNYKLKRGVSKKFALTKSEVEAIYALPPSHFRDLFLISCCTGLRYSDVTRLSDDNIVEIDGSMYVRLDEMQKVEGRGVMVKADYVFPFGEDLLRDYKRNEDAPISMHQNIKNIGKAIGLGKPLTFHISRHTFLTHVAIKTGSVFSVMKMGGISSIATAQGYVDMGNLLTGVL
jgi:integrase